MCPDTPYNFLLSISIAAMDSHIMLIILVSYLYFCLSRSSRCGDLLHRHLPPVTYQRSMFLGANRYSTFLKFSQNTLIVTTKKTSLFATRTVDRSDKDSDSGSTSALSTVNQRFTVCGDCAELMYSSQARLHYGFILSRHLYCRNVREPSTRHLDHWLRLGGDYLG